MEEETGTVTKVYGLMAKVLVHKKSSCEGCGVQGACQSTAEGMEIEALNPVQAREGQKVKILVKPDEYLKGSMLVYGLPLVFFIAGSILGKIIGEEYFKGISSDLIAAIAGFSALILSLAGVRVLIMKAEKKSGYKPVIEEILG
ncbi:MAG TPA: hypothetical protein ENG83_08665 [Nitrospirae bacterium]|nr:soxR reducing system protein RseC [bacterium BMS3Abin06]HDH12246.1 hypothetical protein [Nitrospirota bacterium]HDZ01122.1 hypothetical protein [Nitrospirota bacterium]